MTLQQTASSRYGTLTQTTLTIGGVSAVFDVTHSQTHAGGQSGTKPKLYNLRHLP